MTIKTSYWYQSLPADHIKIGVSRGVPPRFRQAPRMIELQPGPWFRSVDAETYRSLFVAGLQKHDPAAIVEKIDCLAQGRVPVLCCWERPGTGWCHRAWLSVWFAHTLGLVVEEFGLEGQGYAAAHPMLPDAYRKPLQAPAQSALPSQLPLF